MLQGIVSLPELKDWRQKCSSFSFRSEWRQIRANKLKGKALGLDRGYATEVTVIRLVGTSWLRREMARAWP